MSEGNNRPTLTAFAVRNFRSEDKEDSSWLKVGSAWAHKDGKGFDVVLDAVPVGGRVVLRVNEPKE